MKTLLLSVILFSLMIWAKDTRLFWPFAIAYAAVISWIGASVQIDDDREEEAEEEAANDQQDRLERWEKVMRESREDGERIRKKYTLEA
mgnify:CR=1 FL=1